MSSNFYTANSNLTATYEWSIAGGNPNYFLNCQNGNSGRFEAAYNHTMPGSTSTITCTITESTYGTQRNVSSTINWPTWSNSSAPVAFQYPGWGGVGSAIWNVLGFPEPVPSGIGIFFQSYVRNNSQSNATLSWITAVDDYMIIYVDAIQRGITQCCSYGPYTGTTLIEPGTHAVTLYCYNNGGPAAAYGEFYVNGSLQTYTGDGKWYWFTA
jgi:hypothetical protein